MIRGTKRPVAARRAAETVELMAKIHNRFDVEVLDAATGELKQRAVGFNVICDNWWAEAFPSVGAILYGSGTGTPAASDTALFHYEGRAYNSRSADTSHPGEGWISQSSTAILAPETAVGVTLTEVGLAYGSGQAIKTHALLQDMNGNPISITKTETDIIRITSTVFYHFFSSYGSGKIRLTDETGWTYSGFTASDDNIIALDSAGASTGSSRIQSDTSSPWTAQNKTKTYSMPRIGASGWNFAGGIPYLFIAYEGTYSYSDRSYKLFFFPTGLSQITAEAIGTGDGSTTQFATAFALPQNAKVYVNGTEQTNGVTVVPDIPGFVNINRLFLMLSEQATASFPLISKKYLFPYQYINPGLQVPLIFEHLFSTLVPLTSIDTGVGTSYGTREVYTSDDLSTWTLAASTTSQEVAIPSAHQNKKYYKIVFTQETPGNLYLLFKSSALNGYAIRFDTAPAAGAVITADYKTPMIPKDENHVIDFKFSLTFGEYTEG